MGPTRRSVWQGLQQDWGLKVLSAMVGTGLWLYVQSTTNPLVTRHLTRAVKVMNVPRGLVPLEVRPSTVTVVVRARQTDINALREADVQAEADAGRLGRTEAMVGVDVTGLPRHATLDDVTPATVRVLLDVVTKVEKAVEVRTSGEPRQGLEVTGWRVEPTRVTVNGPARAVHDVRRVAGRVDVTSLAATSEFPVRLEALNLAGQPVDGVTLAPAMAMATVQLRRVTVKNVLVTPSLGAPGEGYRIARASVEPRMIAVTGEAGALKALETVPTERIALEGDSGAVRRAVRLRLPEGVRALGSGSVIVNITLEPREAAGPTPSEEGPEPAETGAGPVRSPTGAPRPPAAERRRPGTEGAETGAGETEHPAPPETPTPRPPPERNRPESEGAQ